jgi:hypothetical protein
MSIYRRIPLMSKHGLHSRETTCAASSPPEITREAAGAIVIAPWDDDPELNISCRTKTTLRVEPDIISAKEEALLIFFEDDNFRSGLEINLRLNRNHTFVPGAAPRTCSTSVDDFLWLRDQSKNLDDVLFPRKLELAQGNLLRAQLKFQQLGEDIVFAFRLKYREGPATPRAAKKVVILATIKPRSRVVNLTKG